MIAAFFSWWGQQLRDLLPAAWTQPDDADALIIEVPNGVADRAVAVGVRRKSAIMPLGHFSLDPSGARQVSQAAEAARCPDQVVLKLGAGQLLEKQIALPLAAEPDIERVLAFEMDRETPFSADEVYWHAGVIARDRKRRRIEVRLSLVPRDRLAMLMDWLAAAGLVPTALAANAAGGETRTIALGRTDGPGSALRFRPILALAGLCGALALAVIVAPFVRQFYGLQAVDARIARLSPSIDEAERLRRNILGTGAAVIGAERTRQGDPIAALARVTDALPDDTYLTDFTFRTRRLSMIGQSASAARLLSDLGKGDALRDPVFTAPVTKAEGTSLQAFSIEAELR